MDTQFQLNDADLVGISFLIVLGFLSAYYLVLRIKDYFTERPDPKLTYATLKDLEALRHQFVSLDSDNRAGHARIDEKRSRSVAAIHELIRKNAEHIAALIAQTQMTHQRLSELTVKIERLQERIHA